MSKVKLLEFNLLSLRSGQNVHKFALSEVKIRIDKKCPYDSQVDLLHESNLVRLFHQNFDSKISYSKVYIRTVTFL